MNRFCKCAAALAVMLVASEFSVTAALARGGGSSFMNSPGYQRRLQESRGYVTNQSGSLLTAPRAAVQPPVQRPRKVRKRH
jgi:hypothetical protein